MAARDAILLQTQDKKLQRKILAEDLSYADTVKYGLALEQGRKKVDDINATRTRQEDAKVARLEEQVRRLQNTRPNTSGSCQTCTRPTHGKGACPGKQRECFTCGLMGHFKGSAVCRGKKPADAKKTKNEVKANQIEVLSQVGDEGNDTTGIGRVAEIVRATSDGTQSRNADLRMTVLDPGQAAQPFTVNVLIDSGVYRTLLSEEDWLWVQAGGTNGKARLKKPGSGSSLVGQARS